MDVETIQELITGFSTLPVQPRRPTYLELCKYPHRRFEEICSRLVCFYLAPSKEHGMRDLFLRSLLELVAPDKKIEYTPDSISVISEENAEGKRLDILVHAAGGFVIGIENKITAKLTNPLEVYKNRIGHYSRDNIFRVVLSLHRLTSEADLTFIKRHGFDNLSYEDYFTKVRQNLPLYESNCNKKYLHDLYDFIETLEKMNTNTALTPAIADYFFDNADKIDDLISLYGQFSNQTIVKQSERILELKTKIINRTGDTSWWAWDNLYLGYNQFDAMKPKIGVEGVFTSTKGNPTGVFSAWITVWELKDWQHYETHVLSDYPGAKLVIDEDRAFLYVAEIENAGDEQILNCLEKQHQYLESLVAGS